MNDPELAAAARDGDAEALQALIRRHYPLVLSFARRRLNDRMDAEDAAQETFFKVARSISRYAFRSRFSTWLQRIARNTVTDHLRRRRTRAALEERLRAAAPLRPAEAAAEAPALDALIRLLAPEDGEMLRSVCGEGVPLRRAAARLGVGTGALRWRLFRVRRRLRTAVEYGEAGAR